jgi:hypothetical protein
MGSRSFGIPVQIPVHDVLHRIEEQAACIAWDIYDCVTLESILSKARRVAAKSQNTKELGTTGNSAMDAIELLVEIVNAFTGDTGSNYSMRLLGVMDRARDFVVAQQHQ